MVYTKNNNQKLAAKRLRREGYSYSEIAIKLSASKSTIAKWVRRIKLSEEHLKRLQKKKIRTAKDNAKRKRANFLKQRQEIKSAAIGDIKKISQREFWLVGVALYWKATYPNEQKNGALKFMSGDPQLTKTFIRWLIKIGRIKKEEIRLDLFIGKGVLSNVAVKYWSNITGFPKSHFKRVYRYKKKSSEHGLLQVRVHGSSLLREQLSGWIEGISKDVLYHY